MILYMYSQSECMQSKRRAAWCCAHARRSRQADAIRFICVMRDCRSKMLCSVVLRAVLSWKGVSVWGGQWLAQQGTGMLALRRAGPPAEKLPGGPWRGCQQIHQQCTLPTATNAPECRVGGSIETVAKLSDIRRATREGFLCERSRTVRCGCFGLAMLLDR